MATRKFSIALVAGLAFAAVITVGVKAESVEVVGSANGCSTSYRAIPATDGSTVSDVTLSCPRLPQQVASARR